MSVNLTLDIEGLTPHEFATIEPWLELRKAPMVTGSDIAIIMGNEKAHEWSLRDNPNLKPEVALYMKKIGELKAHESGIAERIGLALENLILFELYPEKTGVEVFRPYNLKWGSHVRDGWKLASADAGSLHTAKGQEFLVGVDAKTTRMNIENATAYWQWQARWYMHVYVVDRWDVPYLNLAKSEFGIVSYQRDLAIEAEMLEKADAFHISLVKRKPPRRSRAEKIKTRF